MRTLSNTASESELAQATRLAMPSTTAPLTTIIGNVPTAALEGGLYRISTDTDITIAEGGAASANDGDMFANTVEYFFIAVGATLNVFSAVAGGTVKVIRVG